MGSMGYIPLGIAVLFGFQGMEVTVSVDGIEYESSYVMVTISKCRRYVGGRIVLNPNAVLDDGLS